MKNQRRRRQKAAGWDIMALCRGRWLGDAKAAENSRGLGRNPGLAVEPLQKKQPETEFTFRVSPAQAGRQGAGDCSAIRLQGPAVSSNVKDCPCHGQCLFLLALFNRIFRQLRSEATNFRLSFAAHGAGMYPVRWCFHTSCRTHFGHMCGRFLVGPLERTARVRPAFFPFFCRCRRPCRAGFGLVSGFQGKPRRDGAVHGIRSGVSAHSKIHLSLTLGFHLPAGAGRK